MGKKPSGRRQGQTSLLAAFILAWLFVVARFNFYLTVSGGIAPGDRPSAYDARNNEGDRNGNGNVNGNGNDNGNGGALCRRIASALDPSSWPDVIYHKDRQAPDDPGAYDSWKFLSVEEDDEQARSTIEEFNKLRKEILTPKLLDLGLSTGRMRPARAFARRLGMLLERGGRQRQRPLIIVVFGNSFTIGSNCGESSVQSGEDCAWPMRLARRFDDIFSQVNSSSLVEWRMLQENAQGSANIAQKIPSLIDEFRDRNVAPDAILLDNSIGDEKYGIESPWYEAVIRVLLQSFPDTVIVSLVDATPAYVDAPKNYDYNDGFTQWFRRVQAHYGLAVVDVAKMVQYLRLHGSESGGAQSLTQDSIDDYRQRQRRHYPIFTEAYNNENSTIIDLLWPQASDMIRANGTIIPDEAAEVRHGEVYWLNFLPRSRKTKSSWYPQNHPPWATHQYVADSVMHALLRVASVGLGCGGDDRDVMKREENSSSLEETVSTRETLNGCFICRSFLTRIDAKSPENAGGRSVADLTSNADHNHDHNATVAVTCGDWRWITDGRNRSGWQSDQKGSLIRFRLGIINNKLPTLSLTYMKSHETFGSFMVTLRAVSRKDAIVPSPSSLLGCDDADKFRDIGWEGEFKIGGKYSNDSTLIPSLELDGYTLQYSLWETVVFPGKLDYWDRNAARPWYLLNRTILSQLMMTGSNHEDAVQYVDVYLMNPSERRIKVQVVTSC